MVPENDKSACPRLAPRLTCEVTPGMSAFRVRAPGVPRISKKFFRRKHWCLSRRWALTRVCQPMRQIVMTRFHIVCVAVLSLALAAPAMARHQHVVPPPRTAVQPQYFNYNHGLPVEDAIRQGYSHGRQYYPSGWGGLYGDGRYPGNVISNWNYPSWW